MGSEEKQCRSAQLATLPALASHRGWGEGQRATRTVHHGRRLAKINSSGRTGERGAGPRVTVKGQRDRCCARCLVALDDDDSKGPSEAVRGYCARTAVRCCSRLVFSSRPVRMRAPTAASRQEEEAPPLPYQRLVVEAARSRGSGGGRGGCSSPPLLRPNTTEGDGQDSRRCRFVSYDHHQKSPHKGVGMRQAICHS